MNLMTNVCICWLKLWMPYIILLFSLYILHNKVKGLVTVINNFTNKPKNTLTHYSTMCQCKEVWFGMRLGEDAVITSVYWGKMQ